MGKVDRFWLRARGWLIRSRVFRVRYLAPYTILGIWGTFSLPSINSIYAHIGLYWLFVTLPVSVAMLLVYLSAWSAEESKVDRDKKKALANEEPKWVKQRRMKKGRKR